MPSRTVEELQDTLDASLAWRRIELSALRAEVDRSSRQNSASPLARVLARSGVALLYAHWEGFTKDAFVAYVDFLSRRRLRLDQLNDGLLRTVFLSLHQRIASGDDAALDHFLKAMRNPSSARAEIPRRGMVNTRSNLRYRVLSEILESVGMNTNDFSTKSNLIDHSLCDARNEIAHGREQFPSAEEFHALYQEMMAIMETVRHRILEEVRTETYKASKFATGRGYTSTGLAAL